MATTIDASELLTYQAAAKKNAGKPTTLDGLWQNIIHQK